MIHEYKTGRSVCGFVEFCAWAGVVIAGIMILAAFGAASKDDGSILALAGVVPALTLLIFSFVLVILTQMARATMDGSVASQKAVIQSQKHHDEVLKALRSYATRGNHSDAAAQLSLVDTTTAKEKIQPVAQVGSAQSGHIEYEGHQIHRVGTKLSVEGRNFSTIEGAKNHIDQLLGKEPIKGRQEPILTAPKGLA